MKNYQKVYLYKIGRFQKDFEYLFDNINVINYVVNSNDECLNEKYITLNDYLKVHDNIIVICDRFNDNDKSLFNSYGLIYEKDYYWFEDFGILLNSDYDELLKYSNDYLLKKMIYTDSYDDVACQYPFTYANIEPNGFVHCCCPGYGYNCIGNVINNSLDKIWSSNAAKIFRLSIINKTYAFCDRSKCPYLKRHVECTESRFDDLYLADHPNELYISFDKTCNLKCSSCRINYYIKNEIQNEIDLACERVLNESNWLKKANRLCLAGDGEVFFSPIYQRILYSDAVKNRKSIEILTNGIFMTKEKLDKLCNSVPNISVYVSIDAATKEIYSKIRKGGNYEFLIKNLEYLSQLRNNNKIKLVELNFVIQRINYKEINDFISLLKKFKFDYVNFSSISNWGTYTDEEFLNLTMINEEGIPNDELKEELEKINKIDYKYIAKSSFLYNYLNSR